VAETTAGAGRPLRDLPLARSPVQPAPPTARRGDWEVSARRSSAALRLADMTPLSKVQVRRGPPDRTEQLDGVPFGRAGRDGSGNLIIGAAPGEWLVLGPTGTTNDILARAHGGDTVLLATAVDLTHGLALVRLTGPGSRPALSKLCPIDLSGHRTPNGAAFRTALAGLTVGVVRDDRAGEPSYLGYCERSSGQYLWDALMDAGDEFGIDVDGYPVDEI
jgi:heterotetrameric sarcosine oxidase gamma subunit